jgi:cytochrome b subunit of formate dehydrogenase
MYREISIIAFVITLGGMGLFCLVRPCKEYRRLPLKKLSIADIFRKLVYLLALLCFVVLAITGFYPTLVRGEHISGYLLMIHATFAPIFAITLAILAVMWSGHCRFTGGDWPWFGRLVQRLTLTKSTTQELKTESCLGQKITFWMIIFLALPLILSIVLSMFPYFGTYWQELLMSVHRYTALFFALTAIVHTYLLIRTKKK